MSYGKSKEFAPIIMGDIMTFIPYIKEDVGPDLAIVNAVMIDSVGNAITASNRYEAGDTIKVSITVKNRGDENIPDRDKYHTNVIIDGIASYNNVLIPGLINLEPGKSVTFTYNTYKQIKTNDNNKSVQFDININKSPLSDSFWSRYLFTEKYKQNNISNIATLYVYETDIFISELSVKIKDENGNILRNNNTIDISADNIEGKYASYCCKLYNNGSHNIEYKFGNDMLFKTGIIGDWFLFFNTVSLQPNETSSDICVNIDLPKSFTPGNYTFILDISQFQDLNVNNNIESIPYTIQN